MDEITVKVTKDEAIVLFEFLSRFSSEEKLTIEDQAEERALWNLNCIFEKHIGEAFDGHWNQALADARNRLRDDE